jgi:flagellar biosynthetic protein FliP
MTAAGTEHMSTENTSTENTSADRTSTCTVPADHAHADHAHADHAHADHPPRTTARKLARFTGHYLEMVVAMVVGMVALGPLWPDGWVARADVHALVMALDMTVVMALWMRVRRHSWPRTAEMSAVMFLPFAALLVPHWLGALPGSALVVAGHVVMFPLMLLAMVWRRADHWH